MAMHPALCYEKKDNNTVQCRLCNHFCIIPSGKRGRCFVRENQGGALFSLVYGKVIAAQIDPIEKKPLYHFQPGSRSFSIATVGCNFLCRHCQNHDIAHAPLHSQYIEGQITTPEQIVTAATASGCSSISYTYTEPTIFFEFALDCARLAHERGLKNIFVSNGYTSPEAVRMIAPFLDANNIDLKGDDAFYREISGARLQPVLDTIQLMKELGVWVEVTTLLIPGCNDSESFLQWAAEYIVSVDPAIPWHLSRFFPTYKMQDKAPTPIETLFHARQIGYAAGLKYVYLGNITGSDGANTLCPTCKAVLIERHGYMIKHCDVRNGCCPYCHTKIAGVELS
jgi:pyruvate formate lyase activating enzyme